VSLAFNYELPDVISDGYLVPVIQNRVLIEELDISRVATAGGDLHAGQLEAALLVEKPLHGVVHATIETACGLERDALAPLRDDPLRVEKLQRILAGRAPLKTLIFTVGVEQAAKVAAIINRWLPGHAVDINGKTPADQRREILREFARGERRFLANCMIAVEGFDVPSVELVAVARPTKSRPLYSQMVGRGTRPAEVIASELGACADAAARRGLIASSAKRHVQVLDFAGNAGKHRLVTSADIFGDHYESDVVERAAELAQRDGPADPRDLLERAQAQFDDEHAAIIAQADAHTARLAAEDEALLFRHLVGTATYHVEQVDAFGNGATLPMPGVYTGGATQNQINLLVKFGVRRETAMGYGRRQASAVLADLKRKRCTLPQARCLRFLGCPPNEVERMNFEQASAEIAARKAVAAA
jgi:superfamily II DNA or RNA helicase